MARKLSAWNVFVSKVFKEGKAKNSNYKFRDALKDASARKGEMGSMSKGTTSGKSMAKSMGKSMTKKRKGRKGGKTCKKR